jgi:16S rRNA (cytidine1402-2'-O)-methyltransferase
MKELLGERQILIAKEITKIHENIIKGKLDDILEKVKSIVLKGELTIVLSSETNKNKDPNVDLNKEILNLTKKMKTADLAKYLSKKFKFSKKEIYQKILMLDKNNEIS